MRKNGFLIFPKRFGYLPYIFLLYLVLPFSTLLYEKGGKLLFGIFLLILFLISYRQLYWYMEQSSVWLIIQLVIIFILTVFYYPTNFFLGFYTANFIGWFQKKEEFYRAFALFCGTIVFAIGLSLLQFDWLKEELFNYLPFLIIMFFSPFGFHSMISKIELEKKLDEANEQIKVLVKREERLRIARDLHDTLGHTLSLITLQSQLAERLIDKNREKAKQTVEEIENTSRSALRQVRELVSDMRTTTITEALSDMEDILTAAKIVFHKDGMGDFSKIPILQQNILGMCLKEAATNIVKHSQAKNCSIHFKLTDSDLTISIKDDGIGFDGKGSTGNGITGMKERLSIIEGSLSISGKKHAEVIIKIPLVNTEKKVGMSV